MGYYSSGVFHFSLPNMAVDIELWPVKAAPETRLARSTFFLREFLDRTWVKGFTVCQLSYDFTSSLG